jgi:tetratricopeptide (TPR) repeat protein
MSFQVSQMPRLVCGGSQKIEGLILLKNSWLNKSCRQVRFNAILAYILILTICPAMAEENRVKAIGLYNLGLAEYKKGATDRAIIFFRRATDYCPDLKDAQYNLGIIYMSQRRFDEAISRFQEVLKRDARDQDANYHLALCFEKSGKTDEAKWHYSQINSDSQFFNSARSRSAALSSNQSTVNSSVTDKPIRDKWAVIIGISKFANPSYNLQFAAKDASDFRDYLVNSGNFKADHILTLLDQQATRANIMRAFGSKWLPNLVEPGDMAVVYISTHGTPAAQDSGGRNYIVAYDTDANDLYASGVDMDELARRIKEIKTDRAVIILDTCYSGASIPGSRGLSRVDSFDTKKLECGRGHLVISASSPNERSWESTSVSNGVFTKYLIDSLKLNSNASVKQVFEACAKKVEWEVKLTRASTQTPQLGGDWQGSPLILSAPATEPRPMIPSMLAEFGRAAN